MSVPNLVCPIICALITVYGARTTTFSGGAIFGIVLSLSPFINSINVLNLTLGFIVSIGLALAFYPSLIIVTQFFDSKRGVALALIMAGGGVGGCVFPPFIELLLHLYSWRGTLLIIGGISFNICAAALLFHSPAKIQLQTSKTSPSVEMNNRTIEKQKNDQYTELKSKLCDTTPALSNGDLGHELNNMLRTDTHLIEFDSKLTVETKSEHSKNNGPCKNVLDEITLIGHTMFDRSFLKSIPLLAYYGTSFFMYLWVSIPIIYLVDKALQHGISDTDAAWLLTIYSIARTVGQLLTGILVDTKMLNASSIYGIQGLLKESNLSQVESTVT